ncbi:myc protein-like [Artemia franciscana]|uniref:BHLH domain-containing protein n=1 Tax=Artemia franciscana TaxID=6661 RepID=A0AA88I6C4_ARTSF|nr:hypothetical protein QYM36_002577 [Artemia franciscana]
MDGYFHCENDIFAQAVADSFLDSSTSAVTTIFGCKEEYNASSFPSDDIWKKFELVTPPTSPVHKLESSFVFNSDYKTNEDVFNSDFLSNFNEVVPGLPLSSFSREARELRHDCMWAGECSSADHTKSRSESLQQQPRVDTPVTDPESDGDSDGGPKVCIIRSNSLHKPIVSRGTNSNDHAYFSNSRQTDKIDHDSLGVQTPSDSEDEIDVLGGRNGVAPGTTVRKVSGPGQSLRLKLRVPATHDPEELQRRITAAIQAAQRKSAQLLVASGSKALYHISKGRPKSTEASKRKSDPSEGESPSKKINRGSDSEDPEKRSIHNCMERKRRVDLRNAFDTLRSYIPDLKETDRVSKVVILRKATLYCQALSSVDIRLMKEKKLLQEQQNRLRKKLELLQGY